MAAGLFNKADVAVILSPLYPAFPVPAIVVIMPVVLVTLQQKSNSSTVTKAVEHDSIWQNTTQRDRRQHNQTEGIPVDII